jgi:uncharacterized UBP type Zn finger protein
MSANCTHLDQIDLNVQADAEGVCTDCLAIGSSWVHLRECMTCGHVACCDDSPNRHATKHYQSVGHPIISSKEPGEDWLWCYVDEIAFLLDEPPRP